MDDDEDLDEQQENGSQTDSAGKKVEPIWCLVANVASETEYGESKEKRSGIKHFPAGAKVYCFPPLWGDGYERIKVIGRHRGSHQFATMIVPSKHLTNWRAKLIYSPYLTEQLKAHWDAGEKSKDLATRLAHGLNTGEWPAAQEEPLPAPFFDIIIRWFKGLFLK